MEVFFNQLAINFYFPEIRPSTPGQPLGQIFCPPSVFKHSAKLYVQNSLIKVAFACCCTFQPNYYTYSITEHRVPELVPVR